MWSEAPAKYNSLTKEGLWVVHLTLGSDGGGGADIYDISIAVIDGRLARYLTLL